MLTRAQIATLRADFQRRIAPGDASFSRALKDAAFKANDAAIAAFYNTDASPDYWVWRTNVSKDEIIRNVSPDGTTFIWAGNGFIERTAGELECWNQLFGSTLSVNPSLPNVRQAFADIFSGTGNAANNRAHLLSMCRRKATVAEKLLSVGGGDGSKASPALLGFEGKVGISDASSLR
jgi:hypothetical protein